jgi:hypothetical protein
MFAGVPVRRAIATEGNTTGLARAQMDPRGADFYTLGTLANFRLFDRTDRVEMGASSVGHYSGSLFRVTIPRNGRELIANFGMIAKRLQGNLR